MDRRTFLTMTTAAAALHPEIAVAAGGLSGLSARAARKGILFGCAVKSGDLADNPALAAAIARQAGIVVPEYELKREIVQAKTQGFDYSGADRIAGFAAAHGMAMRGHCFCWYAANPPWLEQTLRSPRLREEDRHAFIAGYISSAMAHFRGRISEWDVVNEPVDPAQGASDGMRVANVWNQALGERYIDIAYHAARAADPSVKLYMNEFGIESDVAWNEAKRTAILKLLDRLKGRGVPIDGFGIQGHLKPYKEKFNQRVFADFLSKLSGYGLEIAITEMDFMDRGGALSPVQRDADMAAAAAAFLDVALDNRRTRAVLTWGFSDRFSWLSSRWSGDRWPEGQFARGLPLDEGMQPTPLFAAIGRAFDAAPRR